MGTSERFEIACTVNLSGEMISNVLVKVVYLVELLKLCSGIDTTAETERTMPGDDHDTISPDNPAEQLKLSYMITTMKLPGRD